MNQLVNSPTTECEYRTNCSRSDDVVSLLLELPVDVPVQAGVAPSGG